MNAMVSLTNVRRACEADKGGGVRCREFISLLETRCSQHATAPVAPKPDSVRFAISVRNEVSVELERLGFLRGQQRKDGQKQADRIVAHAQQFGQDAHAYRPDFVDSGTLVFSSGDLRAGLEQVLLWDAFKEIMAEYSLGQIFLEQRRQGKTDRLIIPFFKEPVQYGSPAGSVELVNGVLQKMAQAWNIHVYANPPRPDGKIVHTVNCHGVERAPRYSLSFNGGLWQIKLA